MLSFLSHLPGNLVSFQGFLALMAIGLVALWRRGASRPVRRALAIVVAAYAIMAIPIVPYGATRLLGIRYRPFVASGNEPIRAVVVLGAGSPTAIGADRRMGVLSIVGGSRVLEAARVYRLLDNPWLISSGGGAQNGGETSAETMKRALVYLGVPPDRILIESTSTDTHDEAVLIAPMLRQLGAVRFALVTTRVHMIRSERAFRAQGLQPIPAIVPDGAPIWQWSKSLTPKIEGLNDSRDLVHELIGLLYYRLRGWW